MRRMWPIFFASLILLGGCRPELATVGGKPRPKEYRSIVSLSPSTTEIIAQYGPLEKLVGRTESCNYPKFMAQNKGIQVVGSEKPDYEKIRSLSPGLIVYDKSLYNENDLAKLNELGIELYEFKADTVEEFERSLYRFAAKVGSESKMTDYVDKIVAEKGKARSSAGDRRPKVAVLMGGSGGEYMILGKNSFQADVLRVSGGDVVGPDSSIFVPLNAESLVGWNPDVIFLSDMAGIEAWANMAFGETEKNTRLESALVRAAPEAIMTDPRFASTAAVKNRKVASLNPDILLRKGSRVDKLIEALTRYLVTVNGS